MEHIVLDANFLVVPFQFNVDVFAELDRLFGAYKVHTLDVCLDEAKRVENGRYTQLVEKLVSTQNVEVLGTDANYADPVLQRYAENGYVIATTDKELRDRVLRSGGRVVLLRGESHLTVKGE